jgi:transposase
MNTGKKRVHDIKFKERAVQLSKDIGNIAAASRELGIGYSLLQTWIKADELAAAKGNGLAIGLAEKAELERLRMVVEEQKEELEIIKKATAYFAQDRLKRNMPGSKK